MRDEFENLLPKRRKDSKKTPRKKYGSFSSTFRFFIALTFKKNEELINQIKEEEELRQKRYREHLPPHLQFPELSFEELQKKHEEMVSLFSKFLTFIFFANL